MSSNESLIPEEMLTQRLSKLASTNQTTHPTHPLSQSPFKMFHRRPSKPPQRKNRLNSIHETNKKEVWEINGLQSNGFSGTESLKLLRENQDKGLKKGCEKVRKFFPTEQKKKHERSYWTTMGNNHKQLQNEITSLKRLNQLLEKQNKVLVQKIKRTKDENQALTHKSQTLTKVIEEKQSEINLLKLKIDEHKTHQLKQNDLIGCLQGILVQLSDKVQSKCLEKKNLIRTEANQEMMECLEKQIEIVREENIKMKNQIKYARIENGIIKKNNYELQQQRKNTKFIDNQNRKLKARLQTLKKGQSDFNYFDISSSSISLSIDY